MKSTVGWDPVPSVDVFGTMVLNYNWYLTARRSPKGDFGGADGTMLALLRSLTPRFGNP